MKKASKRVREWRKRNPEKRKLQAQIYWERLKNDPIRHAKWLIKKKEWEKTFREKHGWSKFPYEKRSNESKQKHYEKTQIWRKNNPQKIKRYYKSANDKRYYGGNRELVIRRDGEKCLQCGITRQQHYEKYKRDITVDHINRLGRGVKDKDNRLENLQTLCISCHMKKDGKPNLKKI